MNGVAPSSVKEPPEQDGVPSASQHAVEPTVVCVLTRFRFRRPWHVIQTYVAYRWLMRRVRHVAPDGLLKATFVVESWTTCYSLSIWADESAIARFGTSVQEHTAVARDVFSRLRLRDERPEIWSTQWRLHHVSKNLNWDGLDLRQVGVV